MPKNAGSKNRDYSGEQKQKGIWALCVGEDEICSVPKHSYLRFGLEGKGWVYDINSHHKHIACTTEHWGDPLYGIRKSCEYLRPAGPDKVTEVKGHKWIKCGDENKKCALPDGGVYKIRLGMNMTWAFLYASGTVDCSTSNFGDFLLEKEKACWYLDEDRTPKIPKGNWTHCSNENSGCRLEHKSMIRFGQEGKGNGWIYYEIRDKTINCNIRILGDPLKGVAKQCQTLKIPVEIKNANKTEIITKK